MSDQSQLIQSLISEAEAEAEKIVRQAGEGANARKQAVESQAARLMEEAEAEAARRIEQIRRNTQSRIEVESRRERLKARDEVSRVALDLVKQRLESMIGEPAYRDILAGWIAEAAIGLGESEAAVNASAKERELITPELLDEAAARVKSETGRVVRLSLSEDQPLLGQGPVLTAPGGRVAYNNQVSTRILRQQTAIRKIIHERLFGSED